MVFVATGSQRRRKDGNMRQRAECSRYVKVKLFDWNFARNFILPQRAARYYYTPARRKRQ